MHRIFQMRLLAASFLLIHPVATLQTVGIVGAGPAGLTLAVALNRALPDVAVTIFDRSDSCRPALGGGVQLNSGAAVLARLDPALGAAVATLGQPVRRVRSRTAGGDALLDLDLAAAIRGDARARERGLVDAVLLRYAMPLSLLVLFFAFPPVTALAFRMFEPCTTFSDEVGEAQHFLVSYRKHYAVPCPSDELSDAQSIAWVAILLYPVGVIVLSAWLLYLGRSTLLFVGVHLAAHTGRAAVEARDAQLLSIFARLPAALSRGGGGIASSARRAGGAGGARRAG